MSDAYVVTWAPPTRTKDGEGWESRGVYYARDAVDACRQFREYRWWIHFPSLEWVHAAREDRQASAEERA